MNKCIESNMHWEETKFYSSNEPYSTLVDKRVVPNGGVDGSWLHTLENHRKQLLESVGVTLNQNTPIKKL